jgi:integrase/recombinase XerD
MGKLREKMARDLELRNYRPSTCKDYLACARNFAAHFRRSPDQMGHNEICSFLLHLKRTSGDANHKLHLAALKFLYRHTLGRPEEVEAIPWPKVKRPLPDILSGSEVDALLRAVRSIKHRAIFMCAYGAGMRIGEVCSLKIADIDGKRNLIHIRDAKGGRDRYVMIGERLLLCLREYYSQVRPQGLYLFPGLDANAPICTDAVRRVLKKAAAEAGIAKRVYPHMLRHAFATHLLETGTDIRVIQVLLGHGSIRTTTRYAKVSRRHIGQVTSPLDLLGTEKAKPLG